MPATLHRRILLILLLVSGLVGLTLWYGTLAPDPALGAYPDEGDLATNYQQYLDEEITVSGDVLTTSPVTIAAEYGNNEIIHLTITDLAIPLDNGQHLRVYGVAKPNRHVQSIAAFTVPPSGYWYTYTASFVAGLWVLLRIARGWTLERETWTLQRRTPPLEPDPHKSTDQTPPEVMDDA